MIRRRKEKFRPILPKAQQNASAVSESSKTSELPSATNLEKNKASPPAEDCDRTNASTVPQSIQSDNEQVLERSSENEKCASAQEESSEKVAGQNVVTLKKDEVKPNNKPCPLKTRRRKVTALPNTKRANKSVSSPSNTSVNCTVEDEKTSAFKPDQVVQQCASDNSISTIETAPNISSPANFKTSSPSTSVQSNLDIVSPRQKEVNPCLSLALMSPPRPPETQISILHKSSPLAVSRHIRTPNVAQAARVRHDSVRESTTRDRQNKQRAMGKLKLLQQRDPKNEGNVWPELDHNLISMSDLIYLNPPNGKGKELGLRVKLREIEEMTKTAEENREETEKKSEERPTSPSVQEEDEPALVPQLRVNEDGSVVIDEESLVVNSTSKLVEVVDSSPAIYESGLTSKVNNLSFRRRPAAKASRWTEKQTKKFFAALGVVGADFDLMSAMFRKRSRDDLRRKYKVESKRNLAKIDEALRNQHLSKWTDGMFKPESSSEDEEKVSPPKRKTRKRKRSPSPTPLPLPLPELAEDTEISNVGGHDLLASVIQQCEVVITEQVTACVS